MSGGFQPGDYVVYPTHGVGCVLASVDQEIAGSVTRFLVVEIPSEAMKIQIPEARVRKSGLRRLSSHAEMDKALAILSEPRRKGRGPWIQQARHYEEKVKSGDPKILAEVLRDLNSDNPSSSVRRLYETALARLSGELALIRGIEVEAAAALIEKRFSRRPKAAVEQDEAAD